MIAKEYDDVEPRPHVSFVTHTHHSSWSGREWVVVDA